MTYSVKDVAERYHVGEHTVLTWIAGGELQAVNCGRKVGSKKPRWRITADALTAFELLRTPTPPAPRARRKKQDTSVIEFY